MNLLLVDGCNFVIGGKNSDKNHQRIIIKSSLIYLSRQILNSQFKEFKIIIFADCAHSTNESFVDIKRRFVKIIYCSHEEGGADDHIVNFIYKEQNSCQQIIVVTDDEMLRANVVMVIGGSVDIVILSCQEFKRQLNNQLTTIY